MSAGSSAGTVTRGVRAVAGLIAVALLGGLVFIPQAHAASTVAITKPAAGAKLSIAREDVDTAKDGFQTEAAGTSNAGATIEVSQKRPGGAATVVGTTTADSTGKWSVAVTLPAGESVLFATDTADAQNPSPEINAFVVVRYVSTYYDYLNSKGNWILIANPTDAAARADITIAGSKRGDTITIPAKDAAFPTFPGLAGGPVVVDSLDGVPLVVTQRTTWSASDLEEVPSVYDGYLAKKSWFSWYDTKNSGGRDWVVVTNFGTAGTTVTVSIAGVPIGSQTVAVGASAVFNMANLVGGPVLVDADQPVLASRRTLWTPSNFTEVTSTPDTWLSRDYHFTWFDSIGTAGADWILIANTNDSDAAHVRIFPPLNPDGSEASPVDVTLDAGTIVIKEFPNTRNGPLRVTSDVPVLATQRALWSAGKSFEEVTGIAPADMSLVYWQSWYDSQNALGDWMLQANPRGQTAIVDYQIGGATISFSSSLATLEVEFPIFSGKKGGPLTVTGNKPFLQSKRTLWGTTADFMEITGLRGTNRTGKVVSLQPTNVTVADVPNDDGSAQIVSWDAIDDASVEGYWVYSFKTGGVKRRIAFVPRVADPSCTGGKPCFKDTGLTAGTEYNYEVTALSLNVVEGRVGTAKGTPTDDPATAPAGLAAAGGDRGANLNWVDNPETDISGYNVYRRDDPAQPPAPTVCDPANPANPALSTYTKVTASPVATSDYAATGLTNGTRYCFRVTAVDRKAPTPNESAGSDPVVVTPAPNPPIVLVTFPNGAEVLRGDGAQTYDITWTNADADKDFGTVMIEFSANPTDQTPTWQSITDNAADTGKFTWDPPQINSSIRVRVTARDQKGNTGSDTSDANFTVDSTEPSVNVTAPANDLQGNPAKFRGGQTTDIKWSDTESNKADNPITVEYSVDGSTFVKVAGCDGIPDNGVCTWTIPAGVNSTATSAKVRVSLADKAGHSGSGTSVGFIIDSTAPPTTKIESVAGQTVSPARATDDTPTVVVNGNTVFTESGEVHLYKGAKPANCAVTPLAKKKTSANLNDPVTFNGAGETDPNAQFTISNDGVNTLWSCIVDAVGNGSPISDNFVYERDRLAPSAPTGVTGQSAAGSGGKVSLTWNAVTDEPLKGYNVYRQADPLPAGPNTGCSPTAEAGAFDKLNQNGFVTGTSYEDGTGTVGTQYCYKISAVDLVDNESAKSRGVQVTPKA